MNPRAGISPAGLPPAARPTSGFSPALPSAARRSSPVEPEVFEARPVIDAVDHVGEALYLRLPAGRNAAVEDDRPRVVVDQLSLDLPDQPLAHARIGLLGLLLDQSIDLTVAIAGVVALRPAHVILVERGVGIVHFGFGDVEADIVVLAHQLGIPLRSVERIEIGIDVDLLQLVDQEYR